MSRIRRHLTFANVASALALFLAIGGGTTAIALRGVNTVNSGDIRNGAVKTKDLGRNAATGAKVNEGSLGLVPNAAEAENADTLDGFDSGEFQLGNGISGSIAGGVDDGPTFGRIDLGSATLEIDCEAAAVGLNVRDDPGGIAPTAAIPTDVWINGEHESISAEAAATTPVSIPAGPGSGITAQVQVWTADDVVTDARLHSFFYTVPADDLCAITFPVSQSVPWAPPVNSASAATRRPPIPRAYGFVGR